MRLVEKFSPVSWKNDIKMVLQTVGWIDLAEDGDKWWGLVDTVMNLRVP
jgi:hypothetical protein